MSKRAVRHYEFGPFRLDPLERQLCRGSEQVPLTPKAFEILLVLLENRARTVPKKTLTEKVWPDTYVTDSTVAQNIFLLRKLLGTDEGGRSYIETVPKHGYKFVGRVTKVERDDGRDAPEEVLSPGGRDNGGGPPATDGRRRAITSLAALPLVNEGADPHTEYLSQGITESIICLLSQLPQLQVLAFGTVSHYAGKRVDQREVGRALGVQAVLSGKILQLGERLIIRLELVDVEAGWQVWGKQYDRDASDVLAVQADIAREVAQSFHVKLTDEQQRRLSKQLPDNSEAYQLYLKGRFHWNKQTEEGYKKSIEYYERAIAVDPDYALAYCALADSYVLLDLYGIRPPREMMPQARAAAMKAIEINHTLADSHTSLACVKMLYDWDWKEAEREFKLAIALNPRYGPAHQWYSLYLLAMERTKESLDEGSWAVEIDPLDSNSNLHLGWHYLFTRQYGQAIRQLRKTIDLNTNFWPAHILLAEAYGQQGMYAEALNELERTRHIEDTPISLGVLGYTYAVSGKKDECRKVLDGLKKRQKQDYVPPYGIALIYTGLGDKDAAFDWLDKAYEDRDEWLSWLKINPEFDNLRSDLRFTTLLRRVGLPA